MDLEFLSFRPNSCLSPLSSTSRSTIPCQDSMSQRSNQVIPPSQDFLSTPETLSTVFDTGPEFDTSSTDPVVDGDEFCRREKDQCLYELRRAIWECRLFAQSLLHVDDAFSPPMKAGDNCIPSAADPECSELSNVLNLIGCAVRSKEDQVGLSGNMVFSPYRCFVEDVINETRYASTKWASLSNKARTIHPLLSQTSAFLALPRILSGPRFKENTYRCSN
ncbi:hypothetical protein BDN72DRAFT_270756 [Pluteus cervinus]|uniref:Uncharacterized protein n=1 Tax=Pluteus cervinus TaxID=181527 RepID=A0ACD3B7J2_9AGAR|nr:hypothetical protein BDN72DRAFT_270756 [Pluteus cervinus]